MNEDFSTFPFNNISYCIFDNCCADLDNLVCKLYKPCKLLEYKDCIYSALYYCYKIEDSTACEYVTKYCLYNRITDIYDYVIIDEETDTDRTKMIDEQVMKYFKHYISEKKLSTNIQEDTQFNKINNVLISDISGLNTIFFCCSYTNLNNTKGFNYYNGGYMCEGKWNNNKWIDNGKIKNLNNDNIIEYKKEFSKLSLVSENEQYVADKIMHYEYNESSLILYKDECIKDMRNDTYHKYPSRYTREESMRMLLRNFVLATGNECMSRLNKEVCYQGDIKDNFSHGIGTIYQGDEYAVGSMINNFCCGRFLIYKIEDDQYAGYVDLKYSFFNGILSKKNIYSNTEELFSYRRNLIYGKSIYNENNIVKGTIYHLNYYGYIQKHSIEEKFIYKGEIDDKGFQGFGYCEGLSYKSKFNIIKDNYDISFIYEGEWKDGKRNGKGINSSFLGKKTLYDGDWKNGQMDGYGRFYDFNNKLCYIGEFKNHEQSGIGTMHDILTRMPIYIGQWENDMRNGYGINYYYYNHDFYEGEWKNNKQHGKGKLYYLSTNKLEAECEWINDKLNGNYTFYNYDEMKRYETKFVNGVRNGKTKVYNLSTNEFIEEY